MSNLSLDFKQFFGTDHAKTQAEGEILAEKEWLSINPSGLKGTKENFIEFYSSSKSYIEEIVNWNLSSRKSRARHKILKALQLFLPRTKTIFDFGGGVGEDSFFLQDHGYDITYYEINRVMNSFAEHRFKKYVKPIFNSKCLIIADCYLFLDVIEHLHDPFETLTQFSDYTDNLLFTQAFGIHGDDGKQFPYHTNFKMKDIRSHLYKLGFEKVHITQQDINVPPHLYMRK